MATEATAAASNFVGHYEERTGSLNIHEADDLYREIRIENTLQNEQGEKRKLKEGADVDVVIEAENSATVPATPKTDDDNVLLAKSRRRK